MIMVYNLVLGKIDLFGSGKSSCPILGLLDF
jgi:hypothetical protein